MRQVLSLSLPVADVAGIKKIAKKRGYPSLSAYVKFLFQADNELISETELFQSAQEARREYQAGKSIKAKSLGDLL